MVLVYLFFAGNARKSPYIVVTRRAGIEGGAPLVRVNNKFVTFTVLRVKVAGGVVAFIPNE